MRFIDPTIYASRRSPAELELLATAGVVGLIEPISWVGTGRRYAETYIDDFERLVGPEARRVNHYGINYAVAVGVPAQEANNFAVAQAVLEALPRFIKNQENVVAIGEVGLERATGAEEEILRRQARMARQFNLPLVAVIPTHNRRELTLRMLTIFGEEGLPARSLLMNGVTEETLPYVREYGCWYGFTLDRQTHISPERTLQLVHHHGLDGAMVNSAAGRVLGDPLAVPRLGRMMAEEGIPLEAIEKLTYHNAKWFFSQGRQLPNPSQKYTAQTAYSQAPRQAAATR